jgi:hypothetical protein
MGRTVALVTDLIQNNCTKRGSHWTATTIRGILSNEKYTGDVLLQKTYTDENFKRHYNHGEKDQYMIKDHHEAIISHEEFEAAQEILKQRGKEKGVIKGSSKYQNATLSLGKSNAQNVAAVLSVEFMAAVTVNILPGAAQSI